MNCNLMWLTCVSSTLVHQNYVISFIILHFHCDLIFKNMWAVRKSTCLAWLNLASPSFQKDMTITSAWPSDKDALYPPCLFYIIMKQLFQVLANCNMLLFRHSTFSFLSSSYTTTPTTATTNTVHLVIWLITDISLLVKAHCYIVLMLKSLVSYAAVLQLLMNSLNYYIYKFPLT